VRRQPTARIGGYLSLIVTDGSAATRYPVVAEGHLLIGRSSASCDVVISDPLVSREHAILQIGDELTVEDLGSANGTIVAGKPVPARTPVRVQPGQVISIGSASLLVASAVPGLEASKIEPTSGRRAEPAPRSRVLPVHGEVVARDPAMQALYDLVDRIAPGDISVLVLGETGVGKDVVATTIHERSPRRGKPLIRINCAALSESLLESELFGHEAGAFTGSRGAKPGLLETAHEGTVFLDEVGELPLAMQAKLLRVLESCEVTRIGGLSARRIDLRFVSATNRNLHEEVERGAFRRDLFFRLNGASLWVPPLRQRPIEIDLLAALFARAACARLGRASVLRFAPAAMAALHHHSWPGNARELRNVVQRAALLCQGDEITVEDLSFGADSGGGPPPAPAARPEPRDERERIIAALQTCAGNQSRAAELLAIPRRTLVKRLAKYGIPRPQRRGTGENEGAGAGGGTSGGMRTDVGRRPD